jgi:SAM-dependent methyltransferase
MSIGKTLKLIKQRRKSLRERVDVWGRLQELHDSCIPSYCHPNLAASGVAWLRLLRSAALYKRHGSAGPVLDFGSGTGELAHVLEGDFDYHYVEMDETQVPILKQDLPDATRLTSDTLPKDKFAFVFALDSLEHNDDYANLIDELTESLTADGILLVSGPTENFIYKIGRKIAGFTGDQHVTNIYAIEKVLEKRLENIATTVSPFGVPLFRLSLWRKK